MSSMFHDITQYFEDLQIDAHHPKEQPELLNFSTEIKCVAEFPLLVATEWLCLSYDFYDPSFRIMLELEPIIMSLKIIKLEPPGWS